MHHGWHPWSKNSVTSMGRATSGNTTQSSTLLLSLRWGDGVFSTAGPPAARPELVRTTSRILRVTRVSETLRSIAFHSTCDPAEMSCAHHALRMPGPANAVPFRFPQVPQTPTQGYKEVRIALSFSRASLGSSPPLLSCSQKPLAHNPQGTTLPSCLQRTPRRGRRLEELRDTCPASRKSLPDKSALPRIAIPSPRWF